jgi:hypothetical protein
MNANVVELLFIVNALFFTMADSATPLELFAATKRPPRLWRRALARNSIS